MTQRSDKTSKELKACTRRTYRFWMAAVSLRVIVCAFSLVVSLLFAQPTSNAQNPTTAPPNPPTQEKTETLPAFSAQERPLNGGETHSYRLSLTPGQFFHALVEQKEIDVRVFLFGPDGQQIAETDSPNDRWRTEPVLLVADKAGDYRVEVRSLNSKAAPGRYEIKIVSSREATSADKNLVRAQRLVEEAEKLGSQANAAAKRTAIEKFQEALQLFAPSGETYRQAITLRLMVGRMAQLNDFRNVLKYSKEGLSLAQSLNDRRLEGSFENFIGGASDVLGEVKEALVHFERAVVLARQNGSKALEANALNNIGKIYGDASDPQRALEYYLQALPIYKSLANQVAEGIALNNIGTAYTKLGEPNKALEYLQQALSKIRAEATAKNNESLTLTNIGHAYSRLDNNEQALNYYNQARTIQQQTGNKTQEAETLDNIGALYSQQNQPQKAVEYHQQALALQRAAGNVRREAISLSNLGHVYTLLGQTNEGLDYFNQSLSIFRRIGDLNNAAVALEGLARGEQQRGNLSEARKRIEESLSLIETVRAHSGSQQHRASYLASREKAYKLLVEILMQQDAAAPGKGHDAEALQASERGRARSLTEMLNESHVDIRRGVSADLVTKEREIRQSLNAKAQRQIQLTAQKGNQQEIEALKKEISALEDDYQQVQAAIRKASPAYTALTQPQPLDLKAIQEQLDPSTIMLEYSLGDQQSYLWVVTQNSLNTYKLPKREQVEKVARQVYDALAARSVVKSIETPTERRARIAEADAQFQQGASELGRMILAPAAAEFGKKRLVIVADGALQYLPFVALSVASNRPIILDHEIISLPSLSAFAVQRRNLSNRELAPKAVAVIADPVFSTNDARLKAAVPVKDASGEVSTRIIEHTAGGAKGQLSIPRLPFTRWEADQILAVAPRESSMKALDFRANRSIATSDELSKYRYVHFATHGYLDTTRAGLSAIVLSMVDEQGKPQDGFLRTHDIYNLELPAELVVLSACETGLGKDIKGEGLEGLTRGFMYAGARRVVVSLWNVNDKATAGLMQRLYTGMLRNNKTPAAALRAAQIELLRTRPWQSPYYWAAFVMQGEWK
ncbi:MAG TPA: CHAT domain-containing protein [Pyrinomonadaceae bacterium]|nr:CHAT domain-containing protein [Pyrinomonadaceae bacterium]